MSDTITTTITTERTRAVPGFALPIGSRLICTAIQPSPDLDQYVGQVGKVVAHSPGGIPQVEFEVERSGSRTWWVSEWVALPEPGQRITVTSTLEGATLEFKQHIIGREVTFHEAIRRGTQINCGDLRVSDHGYPDCPDVLTVTGASWTPTNHNPIVVDEPVAEPAPALSRVERERQAQRKYEALVEGINTLAENQEWCGEFESWAQDNDVEVTRSCDKDYSIDLTLTYTVSVGSDAVLEAFGNQFNGEHGNEQADNVDAEVTSSVTVYITSSTEPDEMDSWEIEEALRNADYSGWDDWTVDNWNEC